MTDLWNEKPFDELDLGVLVYPSVVRDPAGVFRGRRIGPFINAHAENGNNGLRRIALWLTTHYTAEFGSFYRALSGVQALHLRLLNTKANRHGLVYPNSRPFHGTINAQG